MRGDPLEGNICNICEGEKTFMGHPCTYCNGTGEWNQSAESYSKNHICQCIIWGREFCPICNKPCHHTSSATPKQTIDSGFGGMSTMMSVETTEEPEEEEMITV